MPFASALKDFYEQGSFELTDSQLYFETIYRLQKQAQHLTEDKPEINIYEISLKDITVLRGSIPRERHEQVLTGRVSEHENRVWNERFTDVALVQMGAVKGFNTALNFSDSEHVRETHLTELINTLIFLFVKFPWHSIKLERLFFYHKGQIDPKATSDFYTTLFRSLAFNKSLRKLTITPCSLFQHRKSLVGLLTQHTWLEFLHLEITEANKQDWLEFRHALSIHPNLQFLHLGNSFLDADAYVALTDLLDKNYRIEIVLPEPIDTGLLEAYEPLKQRLSKPGLMRFKEDHLTQDKLFQVALKALDYHHKLKSTDHIKKQVLFKKQFDFLVNNEGHLAITDYQKEEWIKGTQVLPLVYQHHKEYVKDESSLLQLQMNEFVPDGSRTIGYALMEKALETENQFALKSLLHANINLFEFPRDGEEPFLVKALQAKGGLRRIVIEYIQSDQRLAALASEYLTNYPDLRDLFKEFKDHLDDYGTHLVKKDNPSILLGIGKKILHTWRKIVALENPSKKRGKECAEIYLALDRCLKIIGETLEEDSYAAFDEVHKIIIIMKEKSLKALRGLFNSSLLHEKVLELIKKFEMQLLDTKKIVVHEFIKVKDNEIKQLKETHEQEKSVLNQITEDLRAESAQSKAESAQVKAENAEMRKKQAQMEAQISALMRQMRISTFNSAPPSDDSSSAYDETNVEARGFFRP